MDYREARIETITLVAQAGNGGGLDEDGSTGDGSGQIGVAM